MKKRQDSFQKHKRADTIKWTIVWIVIVLMAAALVLGSLQLFAKDKAKPSNWFSKNEQTEEDMGNLVVTPEEEDEAEDEAEPVRKMALRITPIAREDFGDYGLDTASIESAVTITATITPEFVTNPRISWSLSFANPSSEWATGKNVETYISLQESEKQVVVTCNEAFGEQIVLTATPESNPKLAKTCKLDYIARPSTINIRHVKSTGDARENIEITFKKQLNFSIQTTYGVGTVRGEYYLNGYSIRMDVNLQKTLQAQLEGQYSKDQFQLGYYISKLHEGLDLPLTGNQIALQIGTPTEYFLWDKNNAPESTGKLYPEQYDDTFKGKFLRLFINAVESTSKDGEMVMKLHYVYKGNVVQLVTATNSNVDFLTTGLEIAATDFSISTDSQAF